MPKPHTPPRSIRVPTPIWAAATTTAAARGETITDAVIRFLTVYGADELADEKAAARALTEKIEAAGAVEPIGHHRRQAAAEFGLPTPPD